MKRITWSSVFHISFVFYLLYNVFQTDNSVERALLLGVMILLNAVLNLKVIVEESTYEIIKYFLKNKKELVNERD